MQTSDVLNFSAQNGITGSYSTGTLTLTGTATVADFKTALESITFSTTSLVQVDRVIGFTVNDGTDSSATATVLVDIAPEVNLSALDGSNGFQISGEAENDRSGRAVSGAGDVNGDGFADILVGARLADPNGDQSGASYVVFGGTGFAGNLNLSALDGNNGFQITGAAAFDLSGTAVSAAGDVNGDGFADVLIGAPDADSNGVSQSGATYVVFGGASFAANLNLSALDGSNGFKLSGEAVFDQSAVSVSAAGDVNGDGFADVLIGAYFASPNGTRSGGSYVVFGHSGGFTANLDLSALDGSNGFQISGEAVFDQSGVCITYPISPYKPIYPFTYKGLKVTLGEEKCGILTE
ncbi:MAG: hypothetical protein EXR86_15205, partial [Gammaproteobacteria bacterium]|nr:hypothetical protein [Gammaproteobacteria bacterium]